MSALLVLVNILLALLAIVLIVSVLSQEGTRQGLGAITGGAETFFGKNKAKTMEGKLEMITKIAATAFIVLAIVSTLISSNLNKTATVVDTNTGVVSDTVEDETSGEDEVQDETAEDAESGDESAEG